MSADTTPVMSIVQRKQEENRARILGNIVAQCGVAQPNSGEVWCAISKGDALLRRADSSVKLKACVEAVLGFKLFSVKDATAAAAETTSGSEMAV